MPTPPSLRLNWDLIAERLGRAATTPQKKMMLIHLLNGLRKEAPFLPPEDTVMELLCIAVAMSDSDWSPTYSSKSGTGEVQSSSSLPPPP